MSDIQIGSLVRVVSLLTVDLNSGIEIGDIGIAGSSPKSYPASFCIISVDFLKTLNKPGSESPTTWYMYDYQLEQICADGEALTNL